MVHPLQACVVLLSLAAESDSLPLTLPMDRRPAWVHRDGIVMAGSWEPLLFRVRRDGSPGYEPTPEQRKAYEYEHSPQMIDTLKALGVNFVMMHCYKAFGLNAERESMTDAVKFAKLCHDAGLRVGVYNFSGTLGWELFYREIPEAKDWVVRDAKGEPVTYGKAGYRYYVNRGHPGVQAYLHKLVAFAVKDVRADLLHFDNYHVGPGSEPDSARRFREYLRKTFSPKQRERMGIVDLASVRPPLKAPMSDPLRRAWFDFSCQSQADSYYDLCRYARSLREDILVECNPQGVQSHIHSPVDHGRLLQGGEAFWDEGVRPGYKQGALKTRIRTYKVARRMGNMAFTYATNPLEMAEAMAFNLDCLGCICWFEYGKMSVYPGETDPLSRSVAPFIRFFHARRDLLGDAVVVADVAVLRNFSSMAFGDATSAGLPSSVEQALITNRVPFQIIYDHQLGEAKAYRVLILPGCAAMSDQQIRQVVRYVGSGGRLLIVGNAATHDEWMFPRGHAGLAELAGKPGVVQTSDATAVVDALSKALDGEMSVRVDGPEGLCMELTEQARRRLVHLVNYRPENPAKNVRVRLHVPDGRHVKEVSLWNPRRDEAVGVAFEVQGQTATFLVPSVDVYEVAVVSFR